MTQVHILHIEFKDQKFPFRGSTAVAALNGCNYTYNVNIFVVIIINGSSCIRRDYHHPRLDLVKLPQQTEMLISFIDITWGFMVLWNSCSEGQYWLWHGVAPGELLGRCNACHAHKRVA